MDSKYQYTFIKVLSCLAWADGAASEDEKNKLCDLMTSMGATVDKSAIATLINTTRHVTPDLVQDVKSLSFEAFVGLVVFALEIAAVDKVITGAEQAVLRQIAGVHLSPEKIKTMYEWLIQKRKADRLFDEVFEAP